VQSRKYREYWRWIFLVQTPGKHGLGMFKKADSQLAEANVGIV
jgi:hypothetical protein